MKPKDIPTKHAEPQKESAIAMGDTAFAVLDRLAGGGNKLKVDFDNLTVGYGPLQAKVDGALVLDVELAR